MEKVTGKKYILWDFDGTIINSEPFHFRSFLKTVKDFGGTGTEVTWDTYKKVVGAKMDIFKSVLQPCVPCAIDDYFLQKRMERLLQSLDEDCPPTDRAIETLVTLYERGYHMAIASSSFRSYVGRYVAKLGLMDFFDFIVTGDMVTNSKPAPDIFLKAAELFEASPAECVVVEDSHNGVLAGKAGGFYTVGYQNPDSGNQDLSPADVIVPSVAELMNLLA